MSLPTQIGESAGAILGFKEKNVHHACDGGMPVSILQQLQIVREQKTSVVKTEAKLEGDR